METIRGFISFPISKATITISFENDKDRDLFPWVLLAKPALLRQFVHLLRLERVAAPRGTIEYRMNIPENELRNWFCNVARWSEKPQPQVDIPEATENPPEEHHVAAA